MRPVTLWFDFVSPYSYLALFRLAELPGDVALEYRPVLFAGLLGHWGMKGPAELAPKRRYTYRVTHWTAKAWGVPFRYPAGHPFNPLPWLRLAIAAGATPQAVRRIFESLWTTGDDPADAARLAALAKELGVDEAMLAAPEVKDTLRRNTAEAAARGVFGVPTFEADGELFWGADSIGWLAAFLADPTFVRNPEIERLDRLPVSAARQAG
jgi:2-hydroxychromene-2-carboxylate isomerase